MTNQAEPFNRKLLKQRRDSAAKFFAGHDFIVNFASESMIERISERQQNYNLALDLNCHIGTLGQKLLQQNICRQVIFSDLSAAMVANINGIKIIADDEYLPFSNASFNLVASSMSMHLINDLPGTLIQINKCLQPNGLFIATLPGPATLNELRQTLMEAEIEITGGVAPRVAPFADVKTLGYLLQRAGFREIIVDSETIKVSYTNIMSLFADLKNMGQRNMLTKRNHYLRKDVLQRATKSYQNLYQDNEGGILASVEIITITGLAV